MKDNTYESHNGYKVTCDNAVLIKDLKVGKKYRVENGLWDFKVIAIEETRVQIQYAGNETNWLNKSEDDNYLLSPLD